MEVFLKETLHSIKCRDFTEFPSVEIFWKGTVFAEFRVNRPKFYGNRTFPQNFHTMKLAKITVFYVVLTKAVTTIAFFFPKVPFDHI